VTLPASTSQILCAPGIVVSCTVTITWQENTVASNSQEAATNPFQSQTYQLVVNP